MASVNRAAQITKVHRVLKKNYKPGSSYTKETVLDNLLFAACLENCLPEAAETAFINLQERFFDLNEVRVSTIRELTEVLQLLPDAEAAAMRVKSLLHSIFESQYSFDLEPLKKQNLGAAVKQLQEYTGVTPFAIAYVTQTSLGGHAIPVNQGALQALQIVGVLSEAEAAEQRVPGLERAIPKTKGQEFFSLLHQLGVAMWTTPHAPAVRKLLLEIDPDCKSRLPKRATKKADSEAAKESAGTNGEAAATEEAEPAESAAKSTSTKKKTAKKTAATKKTAAAKKTSKKAPAAAKKKSAATKKAAASSSPKKKTSEKAPAAKRLAKKKPK